MPLYLIRQDLTTMDCDAIVNPSNPHLQPGGGLDAAVHKAAGPSLRKACRDVAPCPVGQSRVTPAFRLPETEDYKKQRASISGFLTPTTTWMKTPCAVSIGS